MSRKWTDMQSAERIILQMRQDGRTRREIADALGLEKVQIKNWINRYNRRQTTLPASPKKKGRPRKSPITAHHAMELRIRELEREVELYRSFLHAAGRM
ncbi:transposase [Anaeroselena agilis]|uniref:transposase n=1 Tax=Anaeroselena agilis TaxID=3063788 RepID=UPI0039B6F026